MADTMYAWSRILYSAEVDEKTGVPMSTQAVGLGDEVDAGMLGISDADFEELVRSGAVRSEPYPNIDRADQSPREYFLAKARELEGGAELGTRGSVFAGEPDSVLAQAIEEERPVAEVTEERADAATKDAETKKK